VSLLLEQMETWTLRTLVIPASCNFDSMEFIHIPNLKHTPSILLSNYLSYLPALLLAWQRLVVLSLATFPGMLTLPNTRSVTAIFLFLRPTVF